jgi:hypothetical protein
MMAQTSQATEIGCRQVLAKCDLAVRTLQSDNEALNAEINDLNKLVAVQKAALSTDRAWYKSPSIVIPLSLLVGLAGGVYVSRH